jgi:alkyldihydroxyacetonephosphate synthase
MASPVVLGVLVLIAALVLARAAVAAARRRADRAALEPSYDLSEGERFRHRWGYADTRFEFVGPRLVRVTGTRYPLSGYDMPYFIPFAEEVLGLPMTPADIQAEAPRPPLPAPRVSDAFMAQLRQVLASDQIVVDDDDRRLHSHGQLSVDEIYRLLYAAPLEHTVDLVLYPQEEEQVRAVVRLAQAHGVCLIPYGGGTNVSGALTLPPGETRPMASVDLQRLNRIVWVDEANLLACIEAGITGKQLERELQARGYTMGHDPDSSELSTLGGWISTNASGMKKNRYGNIEDIVLEATLVTPLGDVETHRATPRNSVGLPPRTLLFGSEGNLGIITKAVVKLHPQPACRQYASLVFPRFDLGVAFLKELRQREGVMPASIRLIGNFEFRFGQALKAASTGAKKVVDRLQKLFLLRVLGFKADQMVACTVVMEGARSEVEHQRQVIMRVARRHQGVSGGATNGRRGYTLTFGIAYIRDFFNQLGVLGETFETSAPWDRIETIGQAVQAELEAQCRAAGVQGRPYLSYRVTQTYQTGVCIYFTMGFSGKGLATPVETYHAIERRLRQVILDHGGSLSHHHGVGKVRQRFLPQVQSEASIAVFRQVKQALDPDNVFAAGNGIYAELS